MESWKQIETFPNYEISDQGRVRNVKHERIMARHINRQGIAYVRLTNARPSTRTISGLVATAFMQPHESRWFDSIINLDGNRLNNHISNLMWRPRGFAIEYHRQFKRNSPTFKGFVYLVDTGENFHTLREPAVKYGLLERAILLAINTGEGVWPTGFKFHT